MEPPTESTRSSKCILYDKHVLSAQPNINFTPTGEQITVITFQQQPSGNDGEGRACAYRTIANAGVTINHQGNGSNDNTNGPSSILGQEDEDMDAE